MTERVLGERWRETVTKLRGPPTRRVLLPVSLGLIAVISWLD